MSTLRERYAAYAHEAWSGWMRYMFDKCRKVDDNLVLPCELVIPQEKVERWTRQMNTPYDDLPESEKESDRAEADRYLQILLESPPGDIEKVIPSRLLGATRMADEITALVRLGVIDSRSPAADALLDFREPPYSPRADRMAELTRQNEELTARVKQLEDKEAQKKRIFDYERCKEIMDLIGSVTRITPYLEAWISVAQQQLDGELPKLIDGANGEVMVSTNIATLKSLLKTCNDALALRKKPDDSMLAAIRVEHDIRNCPGTHGFEESSTCNMCGLPARWHAGEEFLSAFVADLKQCLKESL